MEAPTAIPKGHELLFKVTDPNYQGTAADNWGQRCQESIRRERKEIEARYGIRIGQTNVYCVRCNKPCWPGNHVCRDIRLEQIRKRKEEALLTKPVKTKDEKKDRGEKEKITFEQPLTLYIQEEDDDE